MDKNNKKKKSTFSGEEILVRDKDGKFKFLKEGKLVETEKYGKEETEKVSKPTPAQPVLKSQTKLGSLEESVSLVIQKSGLNVTDEVLKVRLKNIVTARLKDIRDSFETKDILTRPVKIGGLGLKEEEADKVVRLAGEEFKKGYKKDLAAFEKYKKVEEPPRKPVSAVPQPKPIMQPPKPVYTPRPAPPFASADAKAMADKKAPEGRPKPVLEVKTATPAMPSAKARLAPPPPSLPIKEKERPEKVELPFEKKPSVKVPAKPEVKVKIEPKIVKEEKRGLLTRLFKKEKATGVKGIKEKVRSEEARVEIKSKVVETRVVRRPELEGGRPRMEDVKFTPKLVGPVDELRRFNLVDFRRLSADPSKAAQRIYEKIELLGEDSFNKKVLGIKSWRQSELVQSYLDLVYENIEKNLTLEQVINLKQSQNLETLSLEEFKAIMDLNKKLRF